jgi:dihydroorotase
MLTLLKNFHLVDDARDILGSLVIEDGIIREVIPRTGGNKGNSESEFPQAAKIIDGSFLLKDGLLLMPAFVDLHAHFREALPGSGDSASAGETVLPSETIESASLAAAAGGFGTVVCMANTKPPIDTPEKAAALKRRSDVLGLIDLYPVLSLSKNMEGKELSGIKDLPAGGKEERQVRLLSEDGKDVALDDFFLSAMNEARRIGIPVSCHCDFGTAPGAGCSRVEENNAIRRVIGLGKKARCHIHIAHVSTKEAVEMIRTAKAEASDGFTLTCEAAPHHIALTEEDAYKLGDKSFGRVNPPLRKSEDRTALIEALRDGTIDAIATDHAPHSEADKAKGAPGFSGLETAFAVCYSVLVREEGFGLSRLSALMSANPARILGLGGGPESRGCLEPGMRADLVIVDPGALRTVRPEALKSRGKNSPFAGREFFGKIFMTIRNGGIVYEQQHG